MGATTKFTATEAAEAFTYMAMAGWDASDMISGIEGIMNLAAASGENLATTSDIVTDALTAFGLSAEDTNHFVDVLAAASSNANTNVGMMGETFKYVAPVAGTLGYSAEDVATAVGLMANSGIKASQAGTALRAALTNLISPSETATAALNELGLGMHSELAEDFTFDMDALADEMAAVDKAAQKVADAQDNYNKVLAENGAESEKTAKAMAKLVSAQDKAKEAGKKLSEAQREQVDAATWYNAAIDDGKGNALDFADTIDALRRAFSNLTEVEQTEYASILFGDRAMSGMLAIINSTEEDIGKLSDAAYRSSFSMDAVTDAVSNSGVEWDKYSDKMWTVEDLVNELAFNFTETGNSAAELVEYLNNDYDMDLDDAIAAVGAFQTAMEESSGTAESMAKTMNDNLPGAVTIMQSAFDALKTAVYEKFEGPLREAVEVATGIFSDLTDVIQTEGIGAAFEQLGGIIAENLAPKFDEVRGKIAEFAGSFSGLTDSLRPFAELVQSSVSEGFAAIASGAKGLVDAFADADYGKIDGVASAAKRFLDAVGAAAVDKFEAVAGLISAFLDAFKNADIAGTMGEIAQNAQGLFASFLTASAKVITEVTAGVVAFTEGFKDGGGADALAKVAKSAGELFNSFLIASDTTISAIGTGIRNFLKGFDDYAVGEAVSELADGVSELFDAVSSTSGAALEDVAKGVAALAESSKTESAGKGASDLAAAFAELGAHVSESLATAIRSVGEAFSGMGQKLGEVVARFGPDIGALSSSLGEFLSVCTTAAQGIVDALQPAWDWINRVFREALQGALTFAIGLVGALVDAFAPLIDIFSNTLSAVIKAFKGDWEGVFEDMKSAGMSFVDFVGSLVDLIKRPFEALIPQMQQIGSDIITGLWNGLKGMWDSVSGWFNEKVGGLVSGAKKLLGIGSPSKVFAEIGRFTVQGMEVGWGKEFGRLEDQVAEDIGTLSGTARLPFEDSAIGRSSAAGISSMLAANGSGRSTDPIEINLILDGDVAATALYDPLRRTAFQRGQNMEAIYA
jgi:ABC-type transporter Mla subunit MlaD